MTHDLHNGMTVWNGGELATVETLHYAGGRVVDVTVRGWRGLRRVPAACVTPAGNVVPLPTQRAQEGQHV
ncbi:hypothetical protein [Novispirillum itersonii]|uniref:hypothetical protein n=1 Tax=Novispirillum itersonii TaxID=189 RepID=UPI00038097B4|nr:hypothetical protein [Novispirillum itersonii]